MPWLRLGLGEVPPDVGVEPTLSLASQKSVTPGCSDRPESSSTIAPDVGAGVQRLEREAELAGSGNGRQQESRGEGIGDRGGHTTIISDGAAASRRTHRQVRGADRVRYLLDKESRMSHHLAANRDLREGL